MSALDNAMHKEEKLIFIQDALLMTERQLDDQWLTACLRVSLLRPVDKDEFGVASHNFQNIKLRITSNIVFTSISCLSERTRSQFVEPDFSGQAHTLVSTSTLSIFFSWRHCSSAITSAGMRSGVEFTSTSIGPRARAINANVTQNPIRGDVLICVFMPYEMACPMASRQRKAAPLRTLAISCQSLIC